MHSARFLLIAAFATGIASAQTCDRACLKTTLDQYLNAVVKHDTSAAPLFGSRGRRTWPRQTIRSLEHQGAPAFIDQTP
jgi:hypothetical protein